MKKLLLSIAFITGATVVASATEWNDTTCWSAACQGTGVPDKHPKPDPTKPNCWSNKCHTTGDPDGKPKPGGGGDNPPPPPPPPTPEPEPHQPDDHEPEPIGPTPVYSFLCKDQLGQTVYHVGFGHAKAQAKAEVDAKLALLKDQDKVLKNCNAEVEFFLRAAGHYNDE